MRSIELRRHNPKHVQPRIPALLPRRVERLSCHVEIQARFHPHEETEGGMERGVESGEGIVEGRWLGEEVGVRVHGWWLRGIGEGWIRARRARARPWRDHGMDGKERSSGGKATHGLTIYPWLTKTSCTFSFPFRFLKKLKAQLIRPSLCNGHRRRRLRESLDLDLGVAGLL